MLRHLRQLAQVEQPRFLGDAGLQAQAERWLQVVAECCLDLGNHVIADRGWRTPTTNREVFAVLRENGAIDDTLAGAMVGWAGLRNILAHMYLEIDHRRLHATLVGELDAIERFAAAMARRLP